MADGEQNTASAIVKAKLNDQPAITTCANPNSI
jgi:hypothetical protein